MENSAKQHLLLITYAVSLKTKFEKFQYVSTSKLDELCTMSVFESLVHFSGFIK